MKSTKTTNILLFFVLTALFFACNKPNPTPNPTPAADPRDAFVGNWKGTFTLTFQGETEESGASNLTITKNPTNATKILITSPGDNVEPIGATVNGNSFTLDQFTLITDIGTIDDQPATYNGTGKINGSNLKIDIIYKAVVDNQQVGGTWKIDATKQ